MRVAKFALLIGLLGSSLVTAQDPVQSQPFQGVTIKRDSQTAVGNTIQMKNVTFVWAGATLTADEAVMNQDTREIELNGHVQIKPGQPAAR